MTVIRGELALNQYPRSSPLHGVQVHTLANVAVTAGKYCRLTLSTPEGAEVSVRGHSVDKLSSTKSAISLDSIAFGQSRTLIVSVTFPHDQQPGHGGEVLEAELRYSNALGATANKSTLSQKSAPPSYTQSKYSSSYTQSKCRCELTFSDIVTIG